MSAPPFLHFYFAINNYYFDPSVYEQRFLALDKHFPKILELKEMYVRFNQSHINDPEGASEDRKNSDEMMSRLSNGPMEGFNNLPKDLKRESRGVSNFEYTSNRILWATRTKTSMLAVPRTREKVHTATGKRRGPYNKQENTQEK